MANRSRVPVPGFLIVAVFVTLAPMGAALSAGESTGNWQALPPESDTYDWVQLTSGELLKGEIIAMYEEDLEFDSDKLNLLTLKWKDVQQLWSARTMEIAFVNGEVARGRVFIDEETIRFVDQDDRQFARSAILSITAGALREIDNWSTKASLGANIRSGNTEQVEISGRVVVIRRGAKNRVNLDYLASFNQTEGFATADNQRATAGWSHYVSKRVFWTPLFGEWFRDQFQNIDSRWTIGAGLGYELVDTSRIDWKVGGGLSYQETHFDSVAEGESAVASTPGLVISTIYEHELTGWMDFTFDWRFNIVNEESGSYTHHLVTGLEFEITKILDLDITMIWDRIKDPQADSDGVAPFQDDYRLVTSFGWEF